MDGKWLLLYLKYISLLELKGKDYKVLLYLLEGLYIAKKPTKIRQRSISCEMGISKSEVSKALKHLVDNRILNIDQELSYESRKKKFSLVYYSEDELENMIEEFIGEL